MKIYRVWSNSNHKIQYTFGYYENKSDAEFVLDGLHKVGIGGTASGPETGIEEIQVIKYLEKPTEK